MSKWTDGPNPSNARFAAVGSPTNPVAISRDGQEVRRNEVPLWTTTPPTEPGWHFAIVQPQMQPETTPEAVYVIGNGFFGRAGVSALSEMRLATLWGPKLVAPTLPKEGT